MIHKLINDKINSIYDCNKSYIEMTHIVECELFKLAKENYIYNYKVNITDINTPDIFYQTHQNGKIHEVGELLKIIRNNKINELLDNANI